MRIKGRIRATTERQACKPIVSSRACIVGHLPEGRPLGRREGRFLGTQQRTADIGQCSAQAAAYAPAGYQRLCGTGGPGGSEGDSAPATVRTLGRTVTNVTTV